MPGIVANGRKRPIEEEYEEDEDRLSSDAPTPSSVESNKRVRYARDASIELGTALESPQRPAARPNDIREEEEYSEDPFQPGSIVRVKLTNFVTYTAAEFHPGPSLNMVIGPNGTGKSTLVCAICLGLGYSPTNLGRAKELGEFVKHGCREAEVELELAAAPNMRSNPVIRRVIKKDGNKSTFFVNGQQSTQKVVLQLARSFSIQIDNLCQFLPQDRVVEFSAMTPVDKLKETQRAAASEQMVKWHEELKDLRKAQKVLEENKVSEQQTLQQLESRQNSAREDVERLRERQDYLIKAKGLEKARQLVQHEEARRRAKEAKEQKRLAVRELRQLEREVQPALQATRDKEEYCEQVKGAVRVRKAIVVQAETQADQAVKTIGKEQGSVKEFQSKLDAEEKGNKEKKIVIKRLERTIGDLQRQMREAPPPFNPAGHNTRMNDLRRQNQQLEAEKDDIFTKIRNLVGVNNELQSKLQQKRNERDSLNTQNGRRENYLKRTSPEAHKAWEWIREQSPDTFSGEVHGPPIVTCMVKDLRYADAVETRINRSDMAAITCTNYQDFKKLQAQIFGTMKLHNVSLRMAPKPVEFFRPPAEDVQSLGFDGWLLDFIEGPNRVLSMLCDSARIHSTGVSLGRQSEEQFQRLQRSGVSNWISGRESYQISRRAEYDASSTAVKPVRRAQVFTNQPAGGEDMEKLDKEIKEIEQDIQDAQQEHNGLKTRVNAIKDEIETNNEQGREIRKEKDDLQKAAADFRLLPERCQRRENELAEIQASLDDTARRKAELESQIDRAQLKIAALTLDYAAKVEVVWRAHGSLLEAEIRLIEADSEVEAMREADTDIRNRLEETRRRAQELQTEFDRQAKDFKASHPRIQSLMDSLTDEESAYVVEWGQKSMEELEGEVQTVQTRLELMAGGDPRAIREFEDREKEIERLKQRIEEINHNLETLTEKITEIRQQWEPELDRLVAKISDSFAHNFEQIGCAGQVSLYKADDFEEWSIQIQVKFREHEELSILTNQRQSGGERAVSTVFYLMALQDMARSPFRVVDEINQGMDPRNERMVHERMVDIACKERTSQYFLITPKLLNDLKFHPKMKVHCIASGEWMPERYQDLDVGNLADLALRVRAAG